MYLRLTNDDKRWCSFKRIQPIDGGYCTNHKYSWNRCAFLNDRNATHDETYVSLIYVSSISNMHSTNRRWRMNAKHEAITHKQQQLTKTIRRMMRSQSSHCGGHISACCFFLFLILLLFRCRFQCLCVQHNIHGLSSFQLIFGGNKHIQFKINYYLYLCILNFTASLGMRAWTWTYNIIYWF